MHTGSRTVNVILFMHITSEFMFQSGILHEHCFVSLQCYTSVTNCYNCQGTIQIIVNVLHTVQVYGSWHERIGTKRKTVLIDLYSIFGIIQLTLEHS